VEDKSLDNNGDAHNGAPGPESHAHAHAASDGNGATRAQADGIDAGDDEVRTDAVSTNYAEALMESAEASGELESISAEVDQLAQLLSSEPRLMALLNTRTLSHADRRQMLERLFKEQLSDVLYRFIQVVNDKDRLASLPGILKAFAKQLAERNGILEADVWSPARLDEAQVETISDRLARAFGAKQVVVHQYEDPSLIGGIKVRVGDTLIDGSVASQLRRIRRRMIERGRENARQLTAIGE
jgi:F-type H+-transporting ATPase subunit delta